MCNEAAEVTGSAQRLSQSAEMETGHKIRVQQVVGLQCALRTVGVKGQLNAGGECDTCARGLGCNCAQVKYL